MILIIQLGFATVDITHGFSDLVEDVEGLREGRRAGQ